VNTVTPVAEKHRFDERALEAFMLERVLGFRGRLDVEEFSGGGSNPTFQLITPSKKYVLRRKPVGGNVRKGAHAIDREFRVMSALHPAGYPVPRPLVYCTDMSVIGAEFYIMENIPGRIFLDYSLSSLKPDERYAIYDSMNAAIARLHNLDYRAAGLAEFGKSGNYFDRQIANWQRQYETSGRKVPEFELLANWLSSHVISSDVTSIVHGDFTLLNCVIDPTRPRVAAVLDWELSTIGHPLADFAYNLSHWYIPNLRAHLGYQTLADKDLAALGIPTLDDYAELYASRVGFSVEKKDLNFAVAFSLFRLAGITIGASARAQDGSAKNESAQLADAHLMPYLNLALSFAEKAGS
jgi:aminoglycoside phosphotransferase (APT) family kinase protein